MNILISCIDLEKFIVKTQKKNNSNFCSFQSLTWLDLSYNRLVRLDDGIFSDLSYLTHLDLSHNKQLLLESRGRTFHGLEDSLLYLDLSNISLLSVRII